MGNCLGRSIHKNHTEGIPVLSLDHMKRPPQSYTISEKSIHDTKDNISKEEYSLSELSGKSIKTSLDHFIEDNPHNKELSKKEEQSIEKTSEESIYTSEESSEESINSTSY